MGKALGKKTKSVFRCEKCSHTAPKWMGRCSQCGEWNTLVEELSTKPQRGLSSGAAYAQGASRPVHLADADDLVPSARVTSGISEADRVLGGGMVPGSMILLGGEPGVGKSTLLAQIAAGVCKSAGSVLYISGEESVAQSAMRARRVGADAPGFKLMAETNLEKILAAADSERPALLALDSIQTAHTDALDSVPGSVGQVRECGSRLLGFAKNTGVPTVVVGHVTKDGNIAGPKTLEHVVDVVLHFEGEGGSPYRVLRSQKNRFGSTHELGVFEMRSSGLAEVENPSQLFLAERPEGVPGSVVVASAEGTRPILVEVQALVAGASAGTGRRTAAGVDGNRVALLLAVLSQRARLDVIGKDVFVNVAGGLRLAEPAIDLGVICAVASSARERSIPADTAVFGEVGLAGEVRAVNLAEIRLAEVAKLGFRRCILPAQNVKRLEGKHELELIGVSTVVDALRALG